MSSGASGSPAAGGARDADSSFRLGRLVRRHGLLIVLTAVVAAAAAALISRSEPQRFESSALLLFRPLGAEFQILGLRYSPSSDDQDAAASADVVTVSAAEVARRTARRGELGLTAAEVEDAVEVSRQPDSRIVAVTASAERAGDAATLANDYARAAVVVRRRADARRAGAARRTLSREFDALTRRRRRGPEGSELRAQIQQLTTLERIGTGSPELIQEAEPAAEPAAPQTRRNIILGGLLGLLLGCALAAVREQSDRRLRHRGQVQAAFDVPVLAEIPRNRSLARKKGFSELPPRIAEAFQLLQARLRYRHGPREPLRVLVTSATRGEGKSTVAWHLTAAAAAAGVDALLIEADLRRPGFARDRDLHPAPGLTEVLAGAVELPAAVRDVPVSAGANGASAPRSMSLLVGGDAPRQVSELFQSARLEALVTDAGHEHELVVVDAPPLPAVADVVPLLGLVDGVVIVMHVGHGTDEQAAQLRAQLSGLGASVLGVVVNGVPSGRLGSTTYTTSA